MIITNRIKLTYVIKGTWKNLFTILVVCLIAFFFNQYVLVRLFRFPSIIPAVLGPALAFFIAFNNNQAYDRWWEARKIWGEVVNDSRSWTRQVLYYISAQTPEDQKILLPLQKRLIHRHIAFLYALKGTLRNHSREQVTETYRKYLCQEEIQTVESETNIPNAILNLQAKDLEYIYEKGWVNGFRFLELNKILVLFCNEMGKSERIKNTVFPTTYNYYTRAFIWFLIVDMIFVVSNIIGPWSIFFGSLVGYVFLVSHSIGQAILNPFEPVPTGIALDQITRNIEINLLEALKESKIPKPIQSVNQEYVM